MVPIQRRPVLTFFSRGRRPAVLLVVATMLTVGLAVGHAQSAVGITPSNATVAAEPGDALNGTVRLANPAGTALHVRASLADWDYDSSGKPEFLDPATLPESASGWIVLGDPDFTMAAGKTADVSYEVRVPANTRPGTYWAAVLFEAEDPNPVPGDTLASFRIRVAFGLYVNVGNSSSDPVIAGMIGHRTSDASYQMQVRLKNRGDGMAALTGNLQVLDATGAAPITVPIERVVALPHGERLLTITLWGPLPAGAYSALAILNTGDASTDIAGQYDFHLDRPLSRNPTSSGSVGAGAD